MKVVSACTALLSDYEVLSVLRDLQAQQVRDFRRSQSGGDKQLPDTTEGEEAELAAEEEAAYLQSIPQNLKDVQFEALAMLSETWRGCAHQTDGAVEAFVKELAAAGFSGPRGPRGRSQGILSKMEQLQVLNLVPTKMVELYTIVDELETRLEAEDVDALLDIVRRTLPLPQPFAELATEGAPVEVPAVEDPEEAAEGEWEDDAAMDEAADFVTEGRADAEDAVGDEAPDDD